MKILTKFIHGGQQPEPATGSVMVPIYQTSTYIQSAPGVHKGYEYSRTKNPTRTALEMAIASIEGVDFGLAFASGMAAADTLLRLLNPGDVVVVHRDLYGGVYRIFTKVFAHYGIDFRMVDLSDTKNFAEISEKTKMVWVETPTNPLLEIIDIEALSSIKKEALLVVDNTFATPYLQQPFALGADVVLHSATKYLGGHSDTVLGLLAVKDAHLAERLYFLQNACGAIAGPMDSFLVLRGIKTLGLRMQAHSQNAEKIVNFLLEHPKVDKVYWPGLSSHKTHAIAKKQMKAFPGMISFEIKENTEQKVLKLIQSLKLFTLAESLGGVESLVCHPAKMTHASIPKEQRQEIGLTDALIRLSVGIEDVTDLIDDLKEALEGL